MLENMGLKVMTEDPTVWSRGTASRRSGCRTSRRHGRWRDVELIAVRRSLPGFLPRSGPAVDDDGFNRLVLARACPGARSSSCAPTRAISARSASPSARTISRRRWQNGAIAKKLIELFHGMFDPADAAGRPRARRSSRRSSTARRRHESRRRPHPAPLSQCLQATLRTNYFQRRRPGRSPMCRSSSTRAVDGPAAAAADGRDLRLQPAGRGIHLRGGKVARGGIRWSDRREDFRTEVLGLMKAQMVKNAVIVPVGSKGGFVVKQPPRPAAARPEGRGHRLLPDADARPARPHRQPRAAARWRRREVVRRDGDDPYLVVAADKGTATFSDIANGVSAEYGFWLGDAFASGGSAGYDHKGMGITARGAWEAVKRHFREIGARHPERGLHLRRRRRHVGRRVRQRHAAVAAHQAARRLRPPAHLRRSRSRSGGELRRARAAVRAAALVLGRLRRAS